MKNYFLLLLFLFYVTSVVAQDKGSVSFSRGIVIPLGKFASSDLAKNNGGAARVGSNIDFSFNYGLPGKIGFAAVMRYQSNRCDSEGLSKSFETELGDNSVHAGSWNIVVMMIGIRKTLKINEKIEADAKFTFGMSQCYAPEIRIFDYTTYGGTSYSRSMSSAPSWASLLSIGIKYTIISNVFVLAKLDMMGTMPNFKDIDLYHREWHSPLNDEYYQLILSTSANFGFGLKF